MPDEGWPPRRNPRAAPELGEVGAGIQVSANAMHVLRHLGLEQAITAVGVRPEAYVFRLHDTGEVIQRFSLSQEELHGAPYTQLHRADLHDLLAARAREFDPTWSGSITRSPASPRAPTASSCALPTAAPRVATC